MENHNQQFESIIEKVIKAIREADRTIDQYIIHFIDQLELVYH